ncbi:MAG: AI-2E family transporter [Phycisphaerae bacterium]
MSQSSQKPASEETPARASSASPPAASAPAAAPIHDEATIRWRGALTLSAVSLLILVLLYLILRELATILQPLLIAVLLCYLIVPAHVWLTQHHIASWISYVFIVVMTLFVIYGMGNLVYDNLQQLTDRIPAYEQKLDALVTRVDSFVEDLRNKFPGEPETPETQPTTDRATATATAAAPEPDGLRRRQIREMLSPTALFGMATSTAGNFLDFFRASFVVIFYLIFLLGERAGFQKRVSRAFGPERAEHIMQVIGSINGAVAQYLGVKTFVSTLVALVSTFILWMFGVDLYVMWGILTFFANFIPYVGSLFAVAVPIALSFLQFDEVWKGFAILVLLVVTQQGTGALLEPRLLGQRLGISPLMIVLSLAFWGFLWGIPGMILAVPLMVIVKIILENIEKTRPIATMMSNI